MLIQWNETRELNGEHRLDMDQWQLLRRGKRVFAAVDLRVLVGVVHLEVFASVMAVVVIVEVLVVALAAQAAAEESFPGQVRFTIEIDPQARGDANEEKEEVFRHVDQ